VADPHTPTVKPPSLLLMGANRLRRPFFRSETFGPRYNEYGPCWPICPTHPLRACAPPSATVNPNSPNSEIVLSPAGRWTATKSDGRSGNSLPPHICFPPPRPGSRCYHTTRCSNTHQRGQRHTCEHHLRRRSGHSALVPVSSRRVLLASGD
jgi:hypothetical protein